MKEIEVKILEINKEKVINKLEKLDAKKIFEGQQDNILFDFEDRSLSKQNKLLRLRQTKDKSFLTYKGSLQKTETKTMDEFETTISDPKAIKKILKSIGLKEMKQYTKHRISYKLDGVRFEIDTLPNIPTFLEIEAPSEEKLKQAVQKLDFSMKDTKAWQGKDIIKHYS